jgi:hypothetical protein
MASIFNMVDGGQIDLQDLAVEEQQSAKGNVLGRGCNILGEARWVR